MKNDDMLPDELHNATEYRLTWPATLPAVCTIDGQWQRTAAGDIEAWYTAEQLRLRVTAMEKATNRSER